MTKILLESPLPRAEQIDRIDPCIIQDLARLGSGHAKPTDEEQNEIFEELPTPSLSPHEIMFLGRRVHEAAVAGATTTERNKLVQLFGAETAYRDFKIGMKAEVGALVWLGSMAHSRGDQKTMDSIMARLGDTEYGACGTLGRALLWLEKKYAARGHIF